MAKAFADRFVALSKSPNRFDTAPFRSVRRGNVTPIALAHVAADGASSTLIPSTWVFWPRKEGSFFSIAVRRCLQKSHPTRSKNTSIAACPLDRSFKLKVEVPERAKVGADRGSG